MPPKSFDGIKLENIKLCHNVEFHTLQRKEGVKVTSKQGKRNIIPCTTFLLHYLHFKTQIVATKFSEGAKKQNKNQN